jgi:hypothetical protein
MKKSVAFLFAFILFVVVFLGSKYIIANKDKQPDNLTETNSSVTPTALKETTKTGSLKEIFQAVGPSQVCSFESASQQYKISGTIYSSGESMRGDFSVETDGANTETHMIVDGGNSYVWMDGQKIGYKSEFGKEDLEIKQEPSNIQGQLDMSAPIDYKCSSWSVSKDMFSLPKEVNFVSF